MRLAAGCAVEILGDYRCKDKSLVLNCEENGTDEVVLVRP